MLAQTTRLAFFVAVVAALTALAGSIVALTDSSAEAAASQNAVPDTRPEDASTSSTDCHDHDSGTPRPEATPHSPGPREAGRGPADPPEPMVVDTPTLVVDPTCANCAGGTIDILLRNSGTAPIPIQLWSANLVDDAGAQLGVKPELHLFEAADPTRPYDGGALAPDGTLIVRASVPDVPGDGSWTVTLFNHGVRIGAFTVVRQPVSLGIHPDVADADTPFLLTPDATTELSLRNEDPVAYPVDLDLDIREHAYSWRRVIAAHGVTSLQVSLTRLPMSSADWGALFRDPIIDGHLIVTLGRSPCHEEWCRDDGPSDAGSPGRDAGPSASATQVGADKPSHGQRPSRSIKLRLQLAYCSATQRAGALFLVLLAGALASLFLHTFIPNQLKRAELTKTLDSLSARVRDLPLALASRLRVSVGTERSRCQALLNSYFSTIQPGFTQTVTEATQRADRLAKRLASIEALGRLREKFEALRNRSMFPTPTTAIEDLFEATVGILCKVQFTDEDLAGAGRNIDALDDQIDLLNDPKKYAQQKPDTAALIKNRAARMIKDSHPAAAPDATRPHLLPPPPWPLGRDDRGFALDKQIVERLEALARNAGTPESVFEALDKSVTPGSGMAQAPPATAAAAPASTAVPEPALKFLDEDLPDVDRLGWKADILREAARLLYFEKQRNPGRKPDYTIQAYQDLIEALISQTAAEFARSLNLLAQIREMLFTHQIEAAIASARSTAQSIGDETSHPERHRWWLRRIPTTDPARNAHRLYAGSIILLTILTGGFWLLAWLTTSFCDPGPTWRTALLIGTLVVPPLWLLFGRRLIVAVLVHLDLRRGALLPSVDNPQVRITESTFAITAFDPTTLTVTFTDRALGGASARETLVPIWTFGHDELLLAAESGWEVTHYFPRAGRYRVRVQFVRTTPNVDASLYLERDVQVRHAQNADVSSFVVGIVGVAVALAPVILGLYAGALEQLAKLDVGSALIAIFLLGFTSDQLKNVITTKP